MEIFTILYVLTLNYIATEAYERVGRAANCPKFTEGDFPGLRIRYRRQGTKAQFRCRKKFERYGPKFATCRSDGTWSSEPPLCVKTGCVPIDPSQVTNLDMEVVKGAVVKFSCLNNYLLIGDTLAYCNGKDWSAPLPRCTAPHELTECDFEEDLCGWKQDDDEEQDWILNVGATQTGNTGPKHDHTLGDTGNGHYLYFETSNPTMTGHQANLLSPMYTEDLSPMCFDFWYHILGPDEKGHVGSLEVFVLDQSQYIDDDDVKPLFYIDGNQGGQWHRGNIFIEKQDEPFQISIVATRALSYISDIAIDDVRLHNCTKNTTSPPVTSSSSSSTTTTSSTTSTSGTTTTTVTTKITETSSPTTVVIETTTTTKTPTETTIKKETTTTKSPETTVVNTSKSETNKPVTTTTESTTVVKTPSLPHTPQTATSSQKVTMERQTSQSTPNPSLTETTMRTTKTIQPEIKTTRQATTQSTKKVKTPGPDTTDTAGPPTVASSSTTSSSTTSTSSSTKSPITSTTVTSSTTSEKYSTLQPTQEQKTTTRSSSKTSSTSPTDSKHNSKSTAKTNAPGKSSSTSKSTASTTTSSSFSSSSSPSSSSFSRSSSSSTFKFSSSSSSNLSSTSSSSYTKTTNEKTGETKRPYTNIHNTTTIKGVTITKAEVTNTDTGGKTSKSAKSTKRTNEITTKSPNKPKGDKDNSITASEGRSQHPEDDTLKPLMIGLGVGIVSGLIIIGVIAYVCVRRRKFYTSRHEDELKPKTNSASLQSLDNTSRHGDELKPEKNSASLQSLTNTSRHEDELKPKTNSASLQSLNNTSRHEDELKSKTKSASL